MYAVVNKTGCTERKGNVQLRLDFFLEFNDPRYNDTLIEGKVIPFHSHFVYFDPDVTEADIKAEMDFHLPNFYKAFQDGWDEVNGGMRHGWATEKRISPLDYSLDTKRVAQCQGRVNELAEFSYKPKSVSEGKEYPATAIDIGSGAIDRGGSLTNNYTRIDFANPANDTGRLDTFEVWAYETMSGTNKVGTFYGSGTDYTSRDGETIGTVEAGAKRTFTGLSIDVTTGDFAGIYYSTNWIETDYSGGTGVCWKYGDQFGTGEQTYAIGDGHAISIYGTGSTPTYTKTISMDALLRATDTEAINLDTLLKAIDTETISLDALIKALGLPKTVALDVILGAGGITQIALDTLLWGKADISVNLDLLIKTLEKQDISLDALIVARNLESISVDAILKATATTSVSLDAIIGELFTFIPSISLDTILFKALPPNRIYTLEIRNGDGDLLAILENAHGISYAQIINAPYPLTFNLPADDSKISNILLANECWLRDNQTDTVVRKFKLQHEMDVRT